MRPFRHACAALRAAVSLAGRRGVLHGRLTLVTSDGTENAAYVTPQPPPEGWARAAADGEPVAQSQAAGGAFFVF